MAKCNWCGAEIPEGEKICPKCKAGVGNTNSSNSTTVSEPTESSSNAMAVILKIIGLVMIFLGIASLFLLDEYLQLYAFIGSIISGFFVLGFSEIIRLLHNINNKLK